MHCTQVENLLSAYHDGELPRGDAMAVEEHFTHCPSCTAALTGISDLSKLARPLRQPIEVNLSWTELARQLDAPALPSARRRELSRWLRSPGALAIAATLLVSVTVALALLTLSGWHQPHSPEPLAAHFQDFLEQLPRSPAAAQEVLLASYHGRRVDAKEALQTLGYVPAASELIPAGYALDEIFLLKMPGCDCQQTGHEASPCDEHCDCGGNCACTQVVYRNVDGRRLSIFEHTAPQPLWFGDRPAIACQCNGTPTKLYEIDAQQLAASWKHGSRYVTLIGAANVEEVKRIMQQMQATTQPLSAEQDT